MNWAIGIDMYTLMCIKLMTNKNLLYKKINKIKFFLKSFFLKLILHRKSSRRLIEVVVPEKVWKTGGLGWERDFLCILLYCLNFFSS